MATSIFATAARIHQSLRLSTDTPPDSTIAEFRRPELVEYPNAKLVASAQGESVYLCVAAAPLTRPGTHQLAVLRVMELEAQLVVFWRW